MLQQLALYVDIYISRVVLLHDQALKLIAKAVIIAIVAIVVIVAIVM